MTPLPPLPPIVDQIRAALPDGREVWLVGGAVRDLLLGRPVKDVDLAVPRGALDLARELAQRLRGAFVLLDEGRGCGRVALREAGLDVDIADFRAADLESDLAARDVTVNALAIDLRSPSGIVDPTGGLDDLSDRVIRLTSANALVDDPLRGLRAVRIAAQLGFRLDRASRDWIAAAAPKLAPVSGERLRDELAATLATEAPAAPIAALARLGLLEIVLPETEPGRLRIFRRLAEQLRQIDGEGPEGPFAAAVGPFRRQLLERLVVPLAADRPRRSLLLLASLFPTPTDTSVDTAVRRLERLRLARLETRWAGRALRFGRRFATSDWGQPLSDRRIHQLCRGLDEAAPEACLLIAAGQAAVPPDLAARLSELWGALLQRYDVVIAPPPLVDGHELAAALGVEPGPQLGEALRSIAEEQAAGAVGSPGEAVELARRLIASRQPPRPPS